MAKLSEKQEFINSEFIKFIKSKELYGNIKNKIDEEFNLSLDVFLKKITCGEIDILCGAFYWEESEEGIKFWRKINDEWLEIINDKLIDDSDVMEKIKSRNKKFIDFLRVRGVYAKFSLELVKDRSMSIINYLDIDIHHSNLNVDQVAGAFDWYYSSDGWDFWNKVDKEWQEICIYNEKFKHRAK